MNLKEAKLQTIRKWEEIIADLQQGGSGYSKTRCGFCEHASDHDYGCIDCPARYICSGDQYGQFAGNRFYSSVFALEAAREVLKEVREISISTGLLGVIKRSLGRIYK